MTPIQSFVYRRDSKPDQNSPSREINRHTETFLCFLALQLPWQLRRLSCRPTISRGVFILDGRWCPQTTSNQMKSTPLEDIFFCERQNQSNKTNFSLFTSTEIYQYGLVSPRLIYIYWVFRIGGWSDRKEGWREGQKDVIYLELYSKYILCLHRKLVP